MRKHKFFNLQHGAATLSIIALCVVAWCMPSYLMSHNSMLATFTVSDNASVLVHNASVPADNAHNASVPAHNVSVPAHNVSVPAHNVSVPAHNVSVPAHNVSVPFPMVNATPLVVAPSLLPLTDRYEIPPKDVDDHNQTRAYSDVCNMPRGFHLRNDESPRRTTRPFRHTRGMMRDDPSQRIEYLPDIIDLGSSPRKDCVVYTVLSGGYEKTLKPFVNQTKDCYWVAFTDNLALNASGWTLRPIPRHFVNQTARLNVRSAWHRGYIISKSVKMLPFLLFPKFINYALFVDGDTTIHSPDAVGLAINATIDSNAPILFRRHGEIQKLLIELFHSSVRYRRVGTLELLIADYLAHLAEGMCDHRDTSFVLDDARQAKDIFIAPYARLQPQIFPPAKTQAPPILSKTRQSEPPVPKKVLSDARQAAAPATTPKPPQTQSAAPTTTPKPPQTQAAGELSDARQSAAPATTPRPPPQTQAAVAATDARQSAPPASTSKAPPQTQAAVAATDARQSAAPATTPKPPQTHAVPVFAPKQAQPNGELREMQQLPTTLSPKKKEPQTIALIDEILTLTYCSRGTSRNTSHEGISFAKRFLLTDEASNSWRYRCRAAPDRSTTLLPMLDEELLRIGIPHPGGPRTPLYDSSFIAFRLNHPDDAVRRFSEEFLKQWHRDTALHGKDQITLTMLLWRTPGYFPALLGDEFRTRGPLIKKLLHGL
ncbi:membrane-associated protein, putative [Bodo saltans]|uniref:Membrane-associated protein, putative n=1 Tax=Bodo saltans TaxID=75058 RepID=A0A0S4JC31_BODSA|nr:membrane-associated protein, putative [Bodo saltans]|eukprot:CUG87684.1 membrane-associated protein, putative [Bodo saltans]